MRRMWIVVVVLGWDASAARAGEPGDGKALAAPLQFLNQFNQQFPADGVNIVPNLLTFLLFLVGPLLTMRLLAEETREGTLETLMTLPMSESQFIIGKFLALWTYYTVILLISLIYHVLLFQVGIPDNGLALSMYFGAWLYGGAVLAITMIWSAVTEDQIVACVATGAFSDDALAMYVEKLLARRDDLVKTFGLEGRFGLLRPNGPNTSPAPRHFAP